MRNQNVHVFHDSSKLVFNYCTKSFTTLQLDHPGHGNNEKVGLILFVNTRRTNGESKMCAVPDCVAPTALHILLKILTRPFQHECNG